MKTLSEFLPYPEVVSNGPDSKTSNTYPDLPAEVAVLALHLHLAQEP